MDDFEIIMAVGAAIMVFTILAGIVKRQKWAWTALGVLIIESGFWGFWYLKMRALPKDTLTKVTARLKHNEVAERNPSHYQSPLSGKETTYEAVKNGVEELARNPVTRDMKPVKELTKYLQALTPVNMLVQDDSWSRTQIYYDCTLANSHYDPNSIQRQQAAGADGRTYLLDATVLMELQNRCVVVRSLGRDVDGELGNRRN
jgi:hypothetical protein